MFTREAVINSDWYKERLVTFQKMEINRMQRGIAYMEKFVGAMKVRGLGTREEQTSTKMAANFPHA